MQKYIFFVMGGSRDSPLGLKGLVARGRSEATPWDDISGNGHGRSDERETGPDAGFAAREVAGMRGSGASPRNAQQVGQACVRDCSGNDFWRKIVPLPVGNSASSYCRLAEW